MTLSRRRFLTIAAAGALVPHTGQAGSFHHRAGRALGAQTSLRIVNTSASAADATFVAVEKDLARLERIFSLYHPASQLSVLNSTGRFEGPALELLEVLALCSNLHDATDGAFDPTVQPLWAHHAGLSPQDVSKARDLIGWSKVRFNAAEVRLTRPGMQLTLNGIAQGYITDRIAGLLRARGLMEVMIDMGEIAALGRDEDGAIWTAGVINQKGEVVARVSLSDRALATSATRGMILNPESQTGHIIDPRHDAPGLDDRLVAISSPSAAIADGLSTAGCLMTRRNLLKAMRAYRSTKLEAFV